jgi:ribosomal protein S18 acetylase RimI-like enzyme
VDDDIRLREAGPDDVGALGTALVEAIDWRGVGDVDLAGVLAVPQLAHYLTGWPRPGDFGTVAVAGAEVAGVAWGRRFPDDDPGYGFVSPDVPELSLAVRPAHRGRGIGEALLGAVIAQARERRHPAVSLSVEDGNRARALYERAGFTVVGRNGGSDTMLLALT